MKNRKSLWFGFAPALLSTLLSVNTPGAALAAESTMPPSYVESIKPELAAKYSYTQDGEYTKALNIPTYEWMPVDVLPKATHKGQSGWDTAKAYVDKFFDMYGNSARDPSSRNSLPDFKNIEIDENTTFRFRSNGTMQCFSIGPKKNIIFRRNSVMTGNPYESEDTYWTGVKRKDPAVYWSIIKNNLQKFIGMNKAEVVALLGPERCASALRGFIDYRVGDNKLHFVLKDDKVEEFSFRPYSYLSDG